VPPRALPGIAYQAACQLPGDNLKALSDQAVFLHRRSGPAAPVGVAHKDSPIVHNI